MKKYFDNLTEALQNFLIEVGELSYFAGRFFKEFWKPPYEFKELLRQCFYIGNRSLLLVSVTGFIIGLVFTLQSRPTLQEFGAVSWMASMVSVSIIREIGPIITALICAGRIGSGIGAELGSMKVTEQIGPIITALICAGRIGSGIGAELGSMKVTEQIDAMEVSGTNPFKYLVITRILATTLMLPLLVIVGDFIAIYGSFLVENIKGNVSFTLYFNQVFNILEYSDIVPATIKTFFFGFAIGLVGCYKGYNCKKGTAGVGKAANAAVVYTSMLLFIIDFVAVFVTNIFYDL